MSVHELISDPTLSSTKPTTPTYTALRTCIPPRTAMKRAKSEAGCAPGRTMHACGARPKNPAASAPWLRHVSARAPAPERISVPSRMLMMMIVW